MQRYWIWTLLPLLAAAGPARGETRRVVFEGAGTEYTWALKDLDPGLPADWSPFQFLVLELRLSSPQRFDLRIHDSGGVRSVRLGKEVPGDALLEAKPLVDQFGQWMGDDWPGKATSLEQLQAAWTAEEKALGHGHFGYCKYGGYE